ncbi:MULTISPECIES: biosynthetic-type acetolactate synthase large subunit [Brevibacillus]|uniref:Acetolactate synthase n=1 Tax=Brevibacillus brevis TaxID=1393 RepID=A0A2Z4MF63_BREBE|nr:MULTISPECIES: biosynthetic-type acetolactate synthase large subunit [Brevibacillus]AWX55096.1 biosynthetic-type acetolactate synthase large subunit [Brevibacillus brevis]NRR21976.1 biosynthetic-type acetolactate synthase large subunit [Brevibacillus sp. MS2.2]
MSVEMAELQKKNGIPPIQFGEEVSGAETLLRCLILEQVEYIFGYPGGAVLPIYDSLYGSYFKHILTRHEQGAIHAADGYARATGKPGVCIATSGPGATNLVTGIATAQMDSVPLVCITGNVAQSLIGTDAFQEANITGITIPITKHSYFVRDIRDLPRIVKEAFHIATTGRPGPVLIDIPKDVANAKAPFTYPDKVEIRGYRASLVPSDEEVQGFVKAVSEAKRPVILAGGGIIAAQAEKELRDFAEKTRIPVINTFMGLGGFSGTHELSLAMPGMHGNYTANQALLNADCVIGLGARFDDRITMGRTKEFAPKARIVHVDIDPAELGKNVETAVTVAGDVKSTLAKAIPLAKACDSEAWISQLKEWQEQYPYKYKKDGDVLKPQAVIELLYNSTDGEAIVTTDVGQHQMWTAQYYKFKHPRSFISSGGLGTMGFGFPAAIGAQIAHPDRTVISVVGDGGFQMTNQELAIVSQYNIPVKVAIVNNQCLGMVRQWQELFYDNRYSQIDLTCSPDFVKLAEAYGVKGLRASTPEEAEAVWAEALAHDGPVVVDFRVAQEENVYPMVASGNTLDQMELGDD